VGIAFIITLEIVGNRQMNAQLMYVQAELWAIDIIDPMLVRQHADDRSVDYFHWRDTMRELRLTGHTQIVARRHSRVPY
jgi:hypothetical protein